MGLRDGGVPFKAEDGIKRALWVRLLKWLRRSDGVENHSVSGGVAVELKGEGSGLWLLGLGLRESET